MLDAATVAVNRSPVAFVTVLPSDEARSVPLSTM
jgi:hypothetical protein